VKKYPIAHVIVTGGTGYIGRRLVKAALVSGCKVTLLSRGREFCAHQNLKYVAWSLGESLPAEAIDSDIDPAAQAVVHLAHDWKNQSGARKTEGGLNIDGTRALVEQARRSGLGRFVFASSQSARADAPNVYGRVKWAIEQLLDRPDEVSARIGLVYGGPQQAMYGLLSKLSGISPILPMVDPRRPVQPIHIDELAEGLLRLASSDHAGWVGLASAKGIRFGDFLKTLARDLHGTRLLIIPIPVQLALRACDLTAVIPFMPTVDRERVLGLAGTQPMQCADHLASLGLEIEDCESRLAFEPSARKTLLLEGRILLRYVMKAWPAHSLLRLYVRALYVKGIRQAIAMPRSVRLLPSLLRWMEPFDQKAALSRRLAIAVAIAQSSPQGELILSRKTVLARNVAVFLGVSVDTMALPIRVLFRRFWS
jgi:nucleoside-diphosphate-sugar epimerase